MDPLDMLCYKDQRAIHFSQKERAKRREGGPYPTKSRRETFLVIFDESFRERESAGTFVGD